MSSTVAPRLDDEQRRPAGASPVSGPGSAVEAEDLASGMHFMYRLVEPDEAKPKDGLLSITSPVGMVLCGRHVGEVVTATTPRGHRRLRIVSVA
jgi:transcription elongation GreA/GreB family factor